MGQKGSAKALLLCGFILLSQHGGAEGLWWRVEAGAMSEESCRALLKKVTSRPKVGFTKWYDVTPQMLEQNFGKPATPDKGTWLACWPENTDLGALDK